MFATVQAVAYLAVLAAAVYLLLLGAGALFAPARTGAFLSTFAQTRVAHVLELSLRLGVGTALVVRAPLMHFGAWCLAFGWLLIVSSVVLAALPWRLHQRFARRAVPLAARGMPLVGAGAVLAGLGLVGALVLPRAAG